MATSPKQNEILQLQGEITQEVNGDAKAIAQGIFGDNANHPDMARVPNQQLDDLYRQKYQSGDRQWLQGEARRDPQQFLDVTKRLGVTLPQPTPPGVTPTPAPTLDAQKMLGNMQANAGAGLAVPAPGAVAGPPVSAPAALPPPALPVAPMVPVGGPPVGPIVPPPAPPPVILGPNGQPLPPSIGA